MSEPGGEQYVPKAFKEKTLFVPILIFLRHFPPHLFITVYYYNLPIKRKTLTIINEEVHNTLNFFTTFVRNTHKDRAVFN